MTDVCSVDLHVELPRTLAAEVEEVQRRDPDVLSRILAYGLTRRLIFDHLAQREVERYESERRGS